MPHCTRNQLNLEHFLGEAHISSSEWEFNPPPPSSAEASLNQCPSVATDPPPHIFTGYAADYGTDTVR